MLARDIIDCDSCPLYKNHCVGGWTSGEGGDPIEPPCTNWNDDDCIEEEMYSNREN